MSARIRRSRIVGLMLVAIVSVSCPRWLRAQAEDEAQGSVRLSAEEALALAETGSPELAASVADVAAAESAARAEDGATAPVLTGSVGASRNERFSATSQGPTRNEDYGGDASVGVAVTAATGTRVEVGARSTVAWRTVNLTPGTTAAVTFGPVYTATLSASATQPLLRGAGTDATRSALAAARARRTQAELERDATAATLARDVLVAYWELWYAERALEVQRAALELSTRQHQEAEQRESELGSLSRVDVLRLAREVAGAQEAVAIAERTRHQRAIELARLLGVDASARWSAHVTTTTPPALDPYDLTLAQATELAARESLSLLASEASLVAADEELRQLRDADQARLDLRVEASAAGLWAEDDLSGLAVPGGRPALSVGARLDLELPLRGGRASGQLGQARAQRAAAESRLEAARQALAAELGARFAERDAAIAQVAFTQETAALASELAEAERQRHQMGRGVITELVQAQQEERASVLRHARAEVDLAVALLRIRHLTGELVASLLTVGTPRSMVDGTESPEGYR